MLAWKLFGNGETPESTGDKRRPPRREILCGVRQGLQSSNQNADGQWEEEEEAKTEAPLIIQAQEMLLK